MIAQAWEVYGCPPCGSAVLQHPGGAAVCPGCCGPTTQLARDLPEHAAIKRALEYGTPTGPIDFVARVKASVPASPLEALLGYVYQVADLRSARGWEWLTLRSGAAYEVGPQPKWLRRGPARKCFLNAEKLLMEHDDLTYVEGWALTYGLPVHHAWCVDPAGRVIEPTWPTLGEAYFGVPISRKLLSEVLLAGEVFGVFFNRAAACLIEVPS